MADNQPESFTFYVKIAQFVAQFGFYSTTISCSILTYLTVFGVKRNFGSYKYLLILFPIVGILFATMELLLYPNVYSHNVGYVFYSTSSPFNLGKEAIIFFLCFYTGVYASTISMLAVQFLYRYWAIFDVTKLRFFKGWRFFVSVLYSVFFGVLWALGILYFDKIDDYSREYLNSQMLQRYNLDISELSGVALVAYNSDGSIRFFNVSSTINMSFIMLIQYVVIIYCAVRMYQDMEKKLQMLSLSVRNLHKQFFKTLIIQIVLPTITLFSPVILIIYLPFLNLKVDLPTGIFLCAFTIYPAMDAIIVLYIVSEYRKAAKRLLSQYLATIQSWLGTVEREQSTTQAPSTNVNVQAIQN